MWQAVGLLEDIEDKKYVPVSYGKWIHTEPVVASQYFIDVKCSVCEHMEPYGNYCKHCGAKMDGVCDG